MARSKKWTLLFLVLLVLILIFVVKRKTGNELDFKDGDYKVKNCPRGFFKFKNSGSEYCCKQEPSDCRMINGEMNCGCAVDFCALDTKNTQGYPMCFGLTYYD